MMNMMMPPMMNTCQKKKFEDILVSFSLQRLTCSLITVHMCMVRPCHSFDDGLSKKCINVYFKKPN